MPQAIIWPLRDTLFTSAVMLQQRPKWTGGRGIPALPTMPWDDLDRPPAINFGRYGRPPIAASTLPVNFALAALQVPVIPLTAVLQPPYPSPYSEQLREPAVVHPLPPPILRYVISGVTRDSTGAVLANCDVHLVESATDIERDQTTSDANGQYSFTTARVGTTYYVVAYKAGSPDVTGATVNTLTGA